MHGAHLCTQLFYQAHLMAYQGLLNDERLKHDLLNTAILYISNQITLSLSNEMTKNIFVYI